MTISTPVPGDSIAVNSLGFAKPPAETRVVVAMSGGVDSSVVAAMLAEEGYDVIGVTLQLYDHGAALAKKGACCAGQDIHDARRVAERIGFPHYVGELLDHRFAELVLVVEDVVRDAEMLRRRPGVVNVLAGAAGALAVARRAVVVELERHADHVEALPLQQARDHGGIDAARHGDDHARIGGRLGETQ